MKIEAKKYYKMRNGEKAYVFGLSKFTAHWIGESDEDILGWNQDAICVGDEPEYDIVSLWEEPKPVELPEKLQKSGADETRSSSYASGEFGDKINSIIDFCESLQAITSANNGIEGE